jgi:hypothetical protein
MPAFSGRMDGMGPFDNDLSQEYLNLLRKSPAKKTKQGSLYFIDKRALAWMPWL